MNTNANDEWIIFDTYREMKVSHNNKLISIRPFDKQTTVPLFCPLCEFPMKTIEDSVSYREYMLCNKCEQHWKNIPKEQIDPKRWQEYLEERELTSRPIFNFK